MKKILTIAILLYSLSTTNGQSLLASGGEYFENSSYSMNWSVGEIAINSYLNDQINEGMHQPIIEVISAVISPKNMPLVEIFPNPTAAKLTIRLSSNEETVNIEVIDSRGTLILTQEIEVQTTIDLSKYESGLFFVKIINKKDYQTFKIIKN
jgi:hypothetical protein